MALPGTLWTGMSRPTHKELIWRIIFGVCVLGALLLAYFVGRGTKVEDASPLVRQTPDVIVAVQDLARLETVSFHIERVIDMRDRQQALFGLIKAEDAVLLVAAGDVTAGVDLAKFSQLGVIRNEKQFTATLTLPPPEVLITRLDNERTFVHTRNTDVLAKRNETLETRARKEAERTLRAAAIKAGILERARENAERVIASLVRSFGYSEVLINWQDQESR